METFKKRFKNENYKAKFAVVCAHDLEVLETVSNAKNENIADFVLIGDEAQINAISKEHKLNIYGLEIVQINGMSECAKKATELIKAGYCNALMKGLLDTSILLKAVLDKEKGLRTGRLISHVTFFILEDGREYFLTDAAINIAPDKETKKVIIKNAVIAANAIGYNKPNVACLCAKEHVDEKMPATVDARYLQEECIKGNIENCVVSGPLALDNAVSLEAAKIKGIKDPVAGHANILLAPDIEAGNIFYKTISFMTKSESGAVVMGAKCPIVMTSRSDSSYTKLNSIVLTSQVQSMLDKL